MKTMQLVPAMEQGGSTAADDKIKQLMVCIHEHISQPLSVEQLARAAHISKRTCFRLFRETLHMTPVDYIRSCRLRLACRMLTESSDSITQIAGSCGLGSASYFGKVFREEYGCSPGEYRRHWHDNNKNRHK